MAQPTPYNRRFNFQNFQQQQPTAPLPGDEVDNELNAVEQTSDQTLVNLAKLQRDDGALRNGIVTQDSLSPSLSIGFTFAGSWAAGVNYKLSDGVSVGSLLYKGKLSHLSSVDNQPDPLGDNATWDLIANITPLAIGLDSVTTAAIQNLAVTSGKLADGATTTQKLADGAVVSAKLADGAATAQKLGDGAVLSEKLANGAVDTTKLADGTVSPAKLADDAVTNAKLANMATGTIKGRATGSTGDPEDLTPAQARSITTSPGVARQTRLTLSGTEQGWTAIPAGTFRVDIGIVGLSTTGTSNPLIQLGDSGGYETTGYGGATIYTLPGASETGANHSTGFLVTPVMASSMLWTAQITLQLDDPATNTWTFSVNGGRSDNFATSDGAGAKSLSAALDRVRITTAGGADTFDAGTITAVCWYA